MTAARRKVHGEDVELVALGLPQLAAGGQAAKFLAGWRQSCSCRCDADVRLAGKARWML
jgi:hypothetical protein